MRIGFPELKTNKRSDLCGGGNACSCTCVIVKIGLCIVLYALFATLFYKQAVRYNGAYYSDLPDHIRLSVEGGSYSFLYFVMGIFCRFPEYHVAIALLEGGMVILTFMLSEKYIRTHYKINGGLATCISASTLFLSSIYIPIYYPYYYFGGSLLRSLITQPWHNITYFGMRLFSVPVFFHTLNILDRYREQFTWKDWLCLSMPLLLSAAIKPNFLVDYSLALLLVLIIDFVRDCFGKNLSISCFFRYISLGSVVFPAVAILFYQMRILYAGDASENGMRIVFLASQYMSQGMKAVFIGMIRDIAFPLLIVVYGYKSFSRKEKFVYGLFMITLIQRVILEETGPRAAYGNFTWGIYNVAYLLFLYMIPRFIQMVRMVPRRQKKWKEWCFALAGSGLLCAHLFFGLKHFLMLFGGSAYLI